MREVGSLIGVSHVTISQFENGKLDLPEYRIEQLVKAYGLKMEEFNKILGAKNFWIVSAIMIIIKILVWLILR